MRTRHEPTGQGRRWAGVVLAAAGAGLGVAGSVLMLTAPVGVLDVGLDDLATAGTLTLFAIVGGVLTWRRPDHVFGWIMVGFATLLGLGGVATEVVRGPRLPPATVVDVASWLQSWIWLAGIVLLGIGLLLFPDGVLPSRRWRYLLRFDLLAMAGVVALAVALWPERGPGLVVVEDDWPGLAGDIGGVLLPVVFGGFVAALVSLVVRYRAASAVVRLQLTWLLLAVGLLAIDLVLAAVADQLGFGDRWWHELFGVAGLFFLPVAIGLAVLRYRLFDLDRIVGRTVSYVVLTATLLAVYTLGVLGIGSVLLRDGSNDLVVAGSTLAVAVLFGPSRRRIQHAVDRRFNRDRYDAARTIEAFGAQLRDDLDVATLRTALCRTATETVQPGHVWVWLARGE